MRAATPTSFNTAVTAAAIGTARSETAFALSTSPSPAAKTSFKGPPLCRLFRKRFQQVGNILDLLRLATLVLELPNQLFYLVAEEGQRFFERTVVRLFRLRPPHRPSDHPHWQHLGFARDAAYTPG
jgi:hypothetical protein